MDELEKWQAKWGEKSKILKSVGFKPFGYDPGIIATLDGVTVDLPCVLVDFICNLTQQRDDLLAACEGVLHVNELLLGELQNPCDACNYYPCKSDSCSLLKHYLALHNDVHAENLKVQAAIAQP